jgi:ATP-dependent Clp protease ATP-binding subunit ClpC
MNERNRFDKFTDGATKALSLAQEEAQRFQHDYIDTEHLLLGLIREGEGVAANVLNSLGVELNKVRDAVEVLIEDNNYGGTVDTILNKVRDAVEVLIERGDPIVLEEIGLAPRARQVIEFAVDEASRLNHHAIGTEHLLLGLVREGEGLAVGVLESLGVRLERVRTETMKMLNQQKNS